MKFEFQINNKSFLNINVFQILHGACNINYHFVNIIGINYLHNHNSYIKELTTCPKQYLGHPYTKKLFVVYLNFRFH